MKLAPYAALASLLAPAALLGVAGCGESSASSAGPKRPNIVLISVCSIRADHMSAYGYARKTTPNIEKLAGESYVFDAAFAQWPKTAPAFASIVSGKYGHTTGAMRITPRQFLPDDHVTLAEVLAAAGYETAAFLSSPALHIDTKIMQGHKAYRDLSLEPNAYITPTQRALEFVKQAGDKPFFVWAHYNNAHYPYNGGGADAKMFFGDAHYDASQTVRVFPKDAQLAVDVPKNHFAYHQIARADIGGTHAGAVPRPRPAGEVSEPLAEYIARYDAGIFGADQAIGQLIDGLRGAGKLDDTIIVVIGDHGESLGDHNYYFEHGRFPYDNNARVVYMIRPAGGAKELRVAAPVAIFSAAPTILEMVGLPAPDAWEARSAWPMAQGKPGQPHVFTEVGFHYDYMLTVHDDTWKLIHIPNALDRKMLHGVEWELYNWRTDPAEANNVFAAESENAARLQGVLREWSAPWVEAAYKKVQLGPLPRSKQARKNLQTLGYVGEGDVEGGDDEPPKPGKTP